jgi:hypothetical protein
MCFIFSIFDQFHSLLLCRLLSVSLLFLFAGDGHTNNQRLPMGDVVYGYWHFPCFSGQFLHFSWCQFIIPKLYLSTGIASVQTASILFSVFKINFHLLTYFSFKVSFSFICSILRISPVCFLCVIFYEPYHFLKEILAHISNLNFISMSFLIVFTILISFLNSSSLLLTPSDHLCTANDVFPFSFT